MKYRLTCLTPLLVGDGQRLSPIDYMVWRDQVNVLDQRRIFRLLAKGPRLDSYLTQLKKAERLDFASWGGFAQNFAGRRIPFEDPSIVGYWNGCQGESLHIPTFAAGPAGPYIPGSAIKGALHTAMLHTSMTDGALRDTAALYEGNRPSTSPADIAEERLLGARGTSRMKSLSVGDSTAATDGEMKIYMLRVASLLSAGVGRPRLGWKQSPNGTVEGSRVDSSTPTFAEMASPNSVFEGTWTEKSFFSQPEILRAMHWKSSANKRTNVFEAANDYAAQALALHKSYAAGAGLGLLEQALEQLELRLGEVRGAENACLLSLGWGGGLLSKLAWLKTEDETYRQIVRQVPLYSRAIRTGMPFPKTRRVIFLGNQPASLPGWVKLEVFPDRVPQIERSVPESEC